MGHFKKIWYGKQRLLGILAHLFDQYTIIVTIFCIDHTHSVLFVVYVKLYKAFRSGNKYTEFWYIDQMI